MKHLSQVVFGNITSADRIVDEGTCVIPMPERMYPAVYSVHHHVNLYCRPLGKLRDFILGPRMWYRCEVVPGMPVPIPRRNENTWDAIHCMSMQCDDPLIVVGAIVTTALRTRRALDAQHMSVPADDSPKNTSW